MSTLPHRSPENYREASNLTGPYRAVSCTFASPQTANYPMSAPSRLYNLRLEFCASFREILPKSAPRDISVFSSMRLRFSLSLSFSNLRVISSIARSRSIFLLGFKGKFMPYVCPLYCSQCQNFCLI